MEMNYLLVLIGGGIGALLRYAMHDLARNSMCCLDDNNPGYINHPKALMIPVFKTWEWEVYKNQK
jgi:hypothetical protein